MAFNFGAKPTVSTGGFGSTPPGGTPATVAAPASTFNFGAQAAPAAGTAAAATAPAAGAGSFKFGAPAATTTPAAGAPAAAPTTAAAGSFKFGAPAGGTGAAPGATGGAATTTSFNFGGGGAAPLSLGSNAPGAAGTTAAGAAGASSAGFGFGFGGAPGGAAAAAAASAAAAAASVVKYVDPSKTPRHEDKKYDELIRALSDLTEKYAPRRAAPVPQAAAGVPPLGLGFGGGGGGFGFGSPTPATNSFGFGAGLGGAFGGYGQQPQQQQQAAAAAAVVNKECKFRTLGLKECRKDAPFPQRLEGVSETKWRETVNALVNAEVTEQLHPFLVTGGESLEGSAKAQAGKAEQLKSLLEKVGENCRHREDKTRLLEQRISKVRSRQALLNARLADVMGKLEVALHLGSPLNAPERQLSDRMAAVRAALQRCGALVDDIRAEAMSAGMGGGGSHQLQVVNPHDEAVLAQALASQRQTLETLARSLNKDRRDVGIILGQRRRSGGGGGGSSSSGNYGNGFSGGHGFGGPVSSFG